MMENSNKTFIASISGGKDSSQSIFRALEKGLKPKFFFTTYDKAKQRNYFHGMSKEIIAKLSSVCKVPILVVETDPKGYAKDFEQVLGKAKEEGVDYCVFGDIDIEEHRQWGSDRCKTASIEALYPLWQVSRKKVVENFINDGFKSVITIVDKTKLPESFLGKQLNFDTMAEMEALGVDVCGERGEFHTFTYYAPYFSEEIKFELSETQHFENYSFKILQLA